jgi:hypothetical protein
MWNGFKLVFDEYGHRVSGCGLGYFPLARYFNHGNESLGSTKFIILLIPINQPTRCSNFPGLLLDVYVRLNMFRAFSLPSSEAQQLQ